MVGGLWCQAKSLDVELGTHSLCPGPRGNFSLSMMETAGSWRFVAGSNFTVRLSSGRVLHSGSHVNAEGKRVFRLVCGRFDFLSNLRKGFVIVGGYGKVKTVVENVSLAKAASNREAWPENAASK